MSRVKQESAVRTHVDQTADSQTGGKYQLSSLWENHSRFGRALAVRKGAVVDDFSTAPSASGSSVSDGNTRIGRSHTPFGRTLRSLPLVSRQHSTPPSSRGRKQPSPAKARLGTEHQDASMALAKDQHPNQTLHTSPPTLTHAAHFETESSGEALSTASDVGSVADHTSMVWSEIGAKELMRQRNVPSITSMHSSSVRYAPPGSIVYRSRPSVPGHESRRDRSLSPLQKQRIHIRKAVKTIGQILSRLGGNNPQSKVHDAHQLMANNRIKAANPRQLHSSFAHVYRDQTPLVIERPGVSTADDPSSQSTHSSPYSPLSRSHSSGCLDTLTSRTAVRQSDDWDAFFPCPSHVTLSTDRGSPIPPKQSLQARKFPSSPLVSKEHDESKQQQSQAPTLDCSQPATHAAGENLTDVSHKYTSEHTSNVHCNTSDVRGGANHEAEPETSDAVVSGGNGAHAVDAAAPENVVESSETMQAVTAVSNFSDASGEAGAEVTSGRESDSAGPVSSTKLERQSAAPKSPKSGVRSSPSKKGGQAVVKGKRRRVRNAKKTSLSPIMVHYQSSAASHSDTSLDVSASNQSAASPGSVTSNAPAASSSLPAVPRSLWGSSPMLWAAGLSSEGGQRPAPIATRSVSPASSLVGSPSMSHTYLESLASDGEENIPSPLSTMSSDWPVDFMYHDSPSQLSPDNLLASLGPVSLSLSEKSSPHIFTYSPRHLTPRMAARLLRSIDSSLGISDARNSVASSRHGATSHTNARTSSHSSGRSQRDTHSISHTATHDTNTPRSVAGTHVSDVTTTNIVTATHFTRQAVGTQPVPTRTTPDQQSTSQYLSSTISDKDLSSVHTGSVTKPRRSSSGSVTNRSAHSLSHDRSESLSSPEVTSEVKEHTDSGAAGDVSSDASPEISNRMAKLMSVGPDETQSSSDVGAAYVGVDTQKSVHDQVLGSARGQQLGRIASAGKLESIFDSSLDSKLDSQLTNRLGMGRGSGVSVMSAGLESSYLEFHPQIDSSPLGSALTNTGHRVMNAGSHPCGEKEQGSAGSLLGSKGDIKHRSLSSLIPEADAILRISPRLDVKEGLTDLSSSETSQLIPACDSAPTLELSQIASTGSLSSDGQRSHVNSAADLVALSSKHELNSNDSLHTKPDTRQDSKNRKTSELGRPSSAHSASLSQHATSSNPLDSSLSSSLISPSSTVRLARRLAASTQLQQTSNSDINSTSSSAKASVHRTRGSQSSGLSLETIDSIHRQLAPVASLASLSSRATHHSPSSPSSSIDPVSATPRYKPQSHTPRDTHTSPGSATIRLTTTTQTLSHTSAGSLTHSSTSIAPVSTSQDDSTACSGDKLNSLGKVGVDGNETQSKLSPMFNVMSVLSHYRDELKGRESRRSSAIVGALTTSSVPKLSRRKAVSLGSDLDLDTPIDEMIWTGSHSVHTTNTIIVNRPASAASPTCASRTTSSSLKHSLSGTSHTGTRSHCSNTIATMSDVAKGSNCQSTAHLLTGGSDAEERYADGLANVTCDSCVLYDTQQLEQQLGKQREAEVARALESTSESLDTPHCHAKVRSRGHSSSQHDAVILISRVPSSLTSSSSCGDLLHAMQKSSHSERDLVLNETASERTQGASRSSSRDSSTQNSGNPPSPGTSGTTKTSHASLEEISEVSSFPSPQPEPLPPPYTSPVKIKTRRLSNAAMSVTPSTAPHTGMTYSGLGCADAMWSDPSVAAALSWGSAVGWSAPNTARSNAPGHPATPWAAQTPAAVQGLVMAALATATAMAGEPATAIPTSPIPAPGSPIASTSYLPRLSRRAEVRNRRPMLPSSKASGTAFGVQMEAALLESMGCPLEALTPSSSSDPTPAPSTSDESPKLARSVTARAKSSSIGRASRASRLSVAASISSDIFLTGTDLLETLENVMASSVDDVDSKSFDEMVTCLEESVLMTRSTLSGDGERAVEVEKVVVAGGVAMLLVNVLMILLALMVVARAYRAV